MLISQRVLKVEKMGRLRKKYAGNEREFWDVVFRGHVPIPSGFRNMPPIPERIPGTHRNDQR
jgi:hypothetical protein